MSTAISDLTVDQIIDEVRKLASEHPATVYPGIGDKNSCFYDKPDCGPGTGCIFGQAMQRLGVSLDDLAGLQNEAQDGSKYIRVVMDRHSIEYTSVEGSWCMQVQQNQDVGRAWAMCVKLADKRYPAIAES